MYTDECTQRKGDVLQTRGNNTERLNIGAILRVSESETEVHNNIVFAR